MKLARAPEAGRWWRLGSSMGVDGLARRATLPLPDAGRSSYPTRPTRSSWAIPSGSPKSSRPCGTIEKSSVGPQRARPHSTVSSRSLEPLLAGHGYSPAITNVLIHAPAASGPGRRPEGSSRQPGHLSETVDGSGRYPVERLRASWYARPAGRAGTGGGRPRAHDRTVETNSGTTRAPRHPHAGGP